MTPVTALVSGLAAARRVLPRVIPVLKPRRAAWSCMVGAGVKTGLQLMVGGQGALGTALERHRRVTTALAARPCA